VGVYERSQLGGETYQLSVLCKQ